MSTTAKTDLTRLLSPKSIAIIGASDKPGRIGTQMLHNIISMFKGDIYPVNPRAEELLGHRAYPDIASLPDGIDMAIIAVPAELSVPAVEALAAKGVGGVTLLTSGFSETGSEGVARQEALNEIIARTGIRLLGPNCIGYMNLHDGVMANFAIPPGSKIPDAGPVALVSQSGGFSSFITSAATRAGVRLGYFVSTGNEAGVVLSEVVEHLVEQDDVRTVLVFSESLKKPEVLIRAARRARELDKPIVLLKTGRTEEAARAAMSHTASVAGSAAVLDAVCAQNGIEIVHSMEELVDLGLAFQDGRRMPKGDVGIITASGGAGVLLTDAAASNGLKVSQPPADAVEDIASRMPQPFYGSIENPFDLTAQVTASPETLGNVLETVRDIKDYDALAVVTWALDYPGNDRLIDVYNSTEKPIFVLCTGYMDKFYAAGLPIYLDPARLMRSLAAVARHSQRPPLDTSTAEGRVPKPVTRPHGERSLLEHDGKALLESYGVPVTRERMVADGQSAADFASALGGRVAIKAMSYQIQHKTEYGAVRLGLSTDEVPTAVTEMLSDVAEKAPDARIEGVLVQEMVPARLEMTVGLQRDPVFGPVVAVGLGGVAVEIMAAAVLLHAPFSLETAKRTISGLLDGRIQSAARGLDDAELEQVARIAVAVGELAVDDPSIVELDVNPVRVHEGRAVAADALIIFDEGVQ